MPKKSSSENNFRKPSSAKKIQKKEVVSSNSNSLVEKLLTERFDCFYGFDLFPKEMKIWVRKRIFEEARKPRYTANIKESLLELRISELLVPYQQLSDFLGITKYGTLVKVVLKKLWYEPCRAKDIIDFFELRALDDFPARRTWLYGFLKTLVKYKLLNARVIGDRESDNIPETTLRLPMMFYLEGIHSESWMEELVIQLVRRDAKQYPRKQKKSPLTPKEKAERKVIQTTYDKVAKIQFEETPLGKSVFNLAQTKKSSDSQIQKAKTQQTLRGDPYTAVKKELEKIPELLEDLSPEQLLTTSKEVKQIVKKDQKDICHHCGVDTYQKEPYRFQGKKYCRECWRNRKHTQYKERYYVEGGE